MNKINRRSVLKGVTLGSGALALSPFIKSISAADQKQAPKRFVFVVKSSGLQGDYLNPDGLTHRGETLVDETLQGRKLPESLPSGKLGARAHGDISCWCHRAGCGLESRSHAGRPRVVAKGVRTVPRGS